MAEKLSQVPLAFDPGTDWTYGTGIDVLGRVIEIVSGKNLDEFLTETIFKPLDMTDTAFSVPPEKLGRFAANYTRTNCDVKSDRRFPLNRNTQNPPRCSPAAVDWSHGTGLHTFPDDD